MAQIADQADGVVASLEIAQMAVAVAVVDDAIQAQREAYVQSLVAAGEDPANDPNF